MVNLTKVSERDALKPNPGNEPHWNRIRQGCFIGFRPSKRGGAGTWIARAYDEDANRYRVKAIGDFGSLAARDRFQAAKKEAEEFAELIEAGGHRREKIETVADACRAYAKVKPSEEGRFDRLVYEDPIAKVKLAKLRKHHLAEWRHRLETKPAQISRNKEGPRTYRDRSPSAVNRDMVPLRAALNKVLAPGAPGTDAAWQEALRPIRNADTQRTLYLDLQQRRALLQHIDAEAEPFVRSLAMLPLRPGATAALSAGDYEKRTHELTIGKDKSGKPRRIIVPDLTAEHLGKAAKDKLPRAPLFARSNGSRWTKDNWNDPIAAAAAKAGLPAGVTAYTLRHSVITDLVDGGLTLLAVAQISDTSVEMIERHYGHLNREAAKAALAGIAL